MKLGKKILKWIGLIIMSLLGILLLAGIIVRMTASAPQPPGEMVDVGGFQLHINSVGVKNDKPTLVIESGAGAISEYYYWLGEGLKDRMRVVRYDRAGIGYSDLSEGQRDPETVAKELHTLLQKSGESPPYILAGHSYGGHYMRVFAQLFPEEVSGLVFLDAPHPDENERLNMPQSKWNTSTLYRIGAIAGDLGLLNLLDKMVGPILRAPGLPDEVTERFTDYSKNGKYLWGYMEEEKWHDELVEFARKASDFGDIPVRVFAGTHLNEEAIRKRGMDPDFIRSERRKMQEEVSTISTDGKVFFMDGGHFFFLDRNEAELVCQEITRLIDTRARS